MVAPGIGTVGGAIVGAKGAATVCLPGCFCVGLVDGTVKGIKAYKDNVYLSESSGKEGTGKSGVQTSGKPTSSVHGHHSFPKFMGGNQKQKLVEMLQLQHTVNLEDGTRINYRSKSSYEMIDGQMKKTGDGLLQLILIMLQEPQEK